MFYKGSTILAYLYILFRSHQTVSQLINSDIGAAGVEEVVACGLQSGTRHTPSTRKKQRVADPAFDALVHNTSEIAAAAKKHADTLGLAALSATLKKIKDAYADPDIIRTV